MLVCLEALHYYKIPILSLNNTNYLLITQTISQNTINYLSKTQLTISQKHKLSLKNTNYLSKTQLTISQKHN